MSLMQDKDKIDLITRQIRLLGSVDMDEALKTNLGEASLGPLFKQKIADVISELNDEREFSTTVSRAQLSSLGDSIEQLAAYLGRLTGYEAGPFVQNRSTIGSELSAHLDNVDTALLPFRVAAQTARLKKMLGSTDDDIERVRLGLQREAASILEKVKSEAETVLKAAKEQADAIQGTARNTATGVSVLQTQVRFADLLRTFRLGAIISGAIALVAFIVFVVYVAVLVNHRPEFTTTAEAVYAAAVRVTLLASIAAVVTFSLKIFRANLNMYYHTLHRQQLTNSIQSFVDAARTDEHRDAVLTKLIEAVSAFGSSGLIDGSDDMPNTAKIIIDALPKVLGKPEH